MKSTSSTISTSTTSDKARWIDDLVESGFPLIPLMPNSKRTFDHNWQHTRPDPTQSILDFPNNYGVVLTDDIVVIDIDSRKLDPERDELGEIKTLLGYAGDADIPTYTVQSRPATKTTGAGLHFYLRKPRGINLKTHSPQFSKGVEIKSFGSFMVGPGSIHPETGESYIVVEGTPFCLLDAPHSFLELFDRNTPTHNAGMPETTDDEATIGRYIDYLRGAPIAVSGAGGDNLTLLVASKGYDYNLSEEMTFSLIRDIWNPKCQPPWSEKDLAVKVRNAYRYASDSPGNLHPNAQFDEVEPPENIKVVNQWKADQTTAETVAKITWTYDRAGKLNRTLDNVKNHFVVGNHGTFMNPLHKLVRFNDFNKKIEFTKPAPWHYAWEKAEQWRDSDTVQFRSWLSKARKWDPSEKDIYDAVHSYARDNIYHPVKDYYASLRWDGVQRVDHLFTRYAGAKDSIYVRAVARTFMIAMIARVYQPGCQHDTMPILEGFQGTGKSSFCRIIGGPWYVDIPLDPKNKDTILYMQGALVIELSEMSHTTMHETNAVKMFLSRGCDTVRMPYGRIHESIPRQSVFIGTINPMGAYLRDKTGNRRHLPVETNQFDLAGLARDRDQLFAEAIQMYKQGIPWHIDNEKIQKMAAREAAMRTEREEWADIIQDWLDSELQNGFIYEVLWTGQIATQALRFEANRVDRYVSMRIAEAMYALGWRRGRYYQDDGERKRGYLNPDYDQQLNEFIEGV